MPEFDILKILRINKTRGGEVDSQQGVFGVATPELVKNILIDSHNVVFCTTWEDQNGRKDVSHPLGQWSVLTTARNPAVIYDEASFCSTIIVYDSSGNALSFHDSMIERSDYGNAAKYYFQALSRHIQNDNVVACIAGTNVPISEADQRTTTNIIDTLIDYVEKTVKKLFPQANFISYVSKQYNNQLRRSDVVPDRTVVRGFVFIPRYLAKDDRNYLLALTDDQVKNFNEMFGF